jgi:hypothetical protein
MTTFPGSPPTRKGALVGLDIFNPIASVIVFQYNPQTVTRTLQAQASGDDSAPSEVMRLKGAPIETLKVDVEIDAADQLEEGDGITETLGVHPQLAALEMLLYPKSGLVITNTILQAVGTTEIVSPIAPMTMLVWGFKRVLPVRLTEFSITEDAHDVNLNPIRAKVSLGLRVLSYNDFSPTHPGYYIFLTHQVIKETFATIGSISNLDNFFSGEVHGF